MMVHKFVRWSAIPVLILAAGLFAQSGQANPAAAPPSGRADPQAAWSETAINKREIQKLFKLVAQQQAQIDILSQKVGTPVTYSCKSESVSVNNGGIEEDCFPYKCKPIDGRCAARVCSSMSQCASPTACYPANYCDYVRTPSPQ